MIWMDVLSVLIGDAFMEKKLLIKCHFSEKKNENSSKIVVMIICESYCLCRGTKRENSDGYCFSSI